MIKTVNSMPIGRTAARVLLGTCLLATFLVCGAVNAGPNNNVPDATKPTRATATFAGGCFWCMEPPYDKLEGVISTTSGYTGGQTPLPSYEQVSAGGTGHAEGVRIVYNPQKIDYKTLLDVFWHNVDPVDSGGQFCDRGNQYRSAIFYENEEQRELAEQSRDALAQSGRLDAPIATELVPASTFYPAEDYHQDYYQKNSLRYHFYRYNCGRDQRLETLWGDGE